MARRGQRYDRDGVAFVAALALHGAIGFFIWVGATSLPSRSRATRPAPRDTPAEVEIDLTDWLPQGEPRSGQPAAEAELGHASPTSPTPPAVARVAPQAAPRANPAAEVAVLEPPPAAEPPAEVTSATPAASVASGNGHPIDLGIGPEGWQRWVSLTPGPPAPAAPAEPRGKPIVRAPPASSTGGLQEGLDARDRALGLGPAGRVASALYQAAHSAEAPQTGTALFNVTVTKSGAVEVSLGESSDKRWQAVAQHAADALKRSPPRIPPPHEGYRLTLKITAEETMPNGLKRRELHGARVVGVPPRFHDVQAEQREIQLKNPTAGVGPDRQEVRGSPMIVELPGVFVEGQGKTCGYRVGVTPLGLLLQGGCDPSNAAAGFQRVVRTEVRSESAF